MNEKNNIFRNTESLFKKKCKFSEQILQNSYNLSRDKTCHISSKSNTSEKKVQTNYNAEFPGFFSSRIPRNRDCLLNGFSKEKSKVSTLFNFYKISNRNNKQLKSLNSVYKVNPFMNKTSDRFLIKNKKFKRNYSSYYMRSNVPLKNNCISDFLISSKKIKETYLINDDKESITNMDKKIIKLGKELNLIFVNNMENNKPLTNRKNYMNSCSNSANKIKSDNNKIKECINEINSENNKIIRNYNNKTKSTVSDDNKYFKNYDDTICTNLINKNNKYEFPKYEYYIKNTNILSPLCSKCRDEFFIKKFCQFYDKTKLLRTDRYKIIDNKFNIIYADDEESYKENIILINKRLIKEGKRPKKLYNLGIAPSETQLRNTDKNLKLMKSIFDYVYPNSIFLKYQTPKIKISKILKLKREINKGKINIQKEKGNNCKNQIYRFIEKSLSTKNMRGIKKILYK